ncbi:MAG: hypothetical protein ACXW18_06130 [Pyrinomonadaceae bacterium]
MNGKECRATRREIDESELNQRLSDQARSHLAVCASCSDFRAERASLRELVGSLEPVAAPGDFELRLRARIASEQGRARQPLIFRFVTSTPAIAAAALVVMLAMSLVWLAQRNKSQAPLVANPPAGPSVPSVPSNGASIPTEESTLASKRTTEPVGLLPVSGKEAKPGRQSRGGNSSLAINKSGLASSTSTDYGVSGAKSIRQIEQRAGEVSLSAPLNPMVVSMQDDRGATRQISLPPVSFGAGRLVDNRIPVSSTNGRSW